MRISFLELKNYRNFRDLRLEFPDGTVAILGPNGAGKTTIVESVAWALFGNVEEVVRTSREGVRRSGADSGDVCSATLEFELGGEMYRLHRAMGGKSLSMKAELVSGGKVLAEGDKPVRRTVERLLGMDQKSFFTSVFARQKELNALQNVQPGERKKTVLRMLRIDGVDDALQRLRGDKRDLEKRIEGSLRTLLTEDGREKENVLKEKLPGLEKERAKADEKLRLSEERTRKAKAELDEAKERRDLLKKDVDAYNTAMMELKDRQSALAQLRKNREKTEARVGEIRMRLGRLPELQKEDEQLDQVASRREHLEEMRARNERATELREGLKRLEEKEKEYAKRLEELKAGLSDPSALEAQREGVEKARTECAAAKERISGRIGELRSRKSSGLETAEKDEKKLEEITRAGAEGVCPTCERTLGEAYGLLLEKLRESIENNRKAGQQIDAEIGAQAAQLDALARKEEALRKKSTRLEQELTKLRQRETEVRAADGAIKETREERARRSEALKALGKVDFSPEEYAKVRAEHDRLRKVHEELVKLREQETELGRRMKDLEDTEKSIKDHELEAKAAAECVAKLEPKKSLYEKASKEFDSKSEALSLAKDDLRAASLERDRRRSEADTAKRELESVVAVKKTIESDRESVERFAELVEVMLSFKDFLIGKVAPALSELTSGFLDAMTAGRYTKVQLSDDYQIQIEDQGELYPVDRFSGGEGDLANLSLRLAISRVIAERTGANPINVLVLDEIFGSQDPERKRNVMSTLTRLSAQFRQIFLITHVEEVKDLMAHVIQVEQGPDGTSSAGLAP
jgi:exonuclease SbcC